MHLYYIITEVVTLVFVIALGIELQVHLFFSVKLIGMVKGISDCNVNSVIISAYLLCNQ